LGHPDDGQESEYARRGRHPRLQGRTPRDPTGGARRNKKVLRRPEHWPLDRFSVIQPEWPGATAAILGGGASIRRPQHFELVARRQRESGWRVIAINNSYLEAPTSDLLYFADTRWWDWNKEKEEFKTFQGLKCTIHNTGGEIEDDSIHMLRNAGFRDGKVDGLSSDPSALRTGHTSGYQALGLAIAAGATRIVLLGYDYRFVDGKSHWHGGHRIPVGEDVYRNTFAQPFSTLKLPEGVSVINCSMASVLKVFPKQPIEDVAP
jgi:hypothetical protein